MSLPLKDCRSSIPESTDMWLEIEAAASGKEKTAIVREVLGEWAKVKIHAHKVAAKRLHANGLQPDFFGEDAEEDGTSRKAPAARGGRR